MLSLKELLQNFSPAQFDALRKALHLKTDVTDPVRLAQKLDNPDRTRPLFAGLDSTEKQVLRYVLSQGGYTTEQELVNRYPDAPPAIVRLREQYLVFTDPEDPSGQTLSVPREHQRFVALTPAEKSTLAGLLSRQPPAYLVDLAQTFGWASSSRRQLTVDLKREWLEGDHLQTFLAGMPDPQKALWQFLMNADGVADTKALQAAGFRKTAIQPGHLDRAEALDHVVARGLLFPNAWPNPSFFIVPSDILARLKGTIAPTVLTASGSAPAQLRAWGLRLLSDLQYFAAYQASGRLQFTQNDIPMRHQLKAFLKALNAPDENYGLFLNASMSALFSSVIKRTTHTLDANPGDSMSRLIAHWRDGENWQESMHYRDAHRSVDGRLDKTLKAKRLILLKALEALPARQWIAYKEFEEFVFTAGWKRVDSGTPKANAYYHNERWARREFVPDLSSPETLANMIAEGLVWLGLVDVGIGRVRKSGWDLTHVRLTDWGRQYLDKGTGRFEPLPAVQAETQFRVLPNLEVNASPRLKPELLAQLFKLSVLKGVHSFSITRESLRDALDEGTSLKDILEFFKTNSSSELPALVQEFIEEVAQKHGHIKLGIAGAYLQVDDPVLLLELRSHRALKDIFQKQVADKLAILTDRDLERIAKTLRKYGYFPVIDKADAIDRAQLKVRW